MNESDRKKIDARVLRVLKDAGLAGSPPVRIETILEHLQVHRDFYDLTDPNLLQQIWHRVRVERERLVRVFRRIRLEGLWLPDEERIMIDALLPAPKQEFASFHEAIHRILEWHRGYFLGDTARTLNPDYQEDLEEEANYGASALMFCGPLFTAEALDTLPRWSSVEALRRRYGNKSWVTTLRRYIEYGPASAMAMVVSTPVWMPTPPEQVGRCRHFIGSPQFRARFSTVSAALLVQQIDRNNYRRAGGLGRPFSICLVDVNGERHEFIAETFFNRHYFLTLLVYARALGQPLMVSAAP